MTIRPTPAALSQVEEQVPPMQAGDGLGIYDIWLRVHSLPWSTIKAALDKLTQQGRIIQERDDIAAMLLYRRDPPTNG